MNYIDENIENLTKEIRRLSKIKSGFKKEKQKYCPHINVKRYASIPRLHFVNANSYSPVDSPIKTKCLCLDCGKRW